jgi:EcsC protein family
MLKTLTDEHVSELKRAKFLLENPSVAARFAHTLANPIEKGMEILPVDAKEKIQIIAARSLEIALNTALQTMSDSQQSASNLAHKAATALSGAAGGAFGLAGLAVELPVSTTIMLRSIADIARSEGEQLQLKEAQIACLEVFALGGKVSNDDAAESGYFGIRAALAGAVSEALKHIATQNAFNQSSPALIRLISQIAARFSVPVTKKAAAQAVPIIGATGGALINTLFMNHFQNVALGHFIIRRLERIYDPIIVREAYEQLSPDEP